MLRFIFYFIFFGLLFYLIWMYFPEAFQTLVSWVGKIYTFLHNLGEAIIEKLNSWMATPKAPEHPLTPQAPKEWLQLLLLWK